MDGMPPYRQEIAASSFRASKAAAALGKMYGKAPECAHVRTPPHSGDECSMNAYLPAAIGF